MRASTVLVLCAVFVSGCQPQIKPADKKALLASLDSIIKLHDIGAESRTKLEVLSSSGAAMDQSVRMGIRAVGVKFLGDLVRFVDDDETLQYVAARMDSCSANLDSVRNFHELAVENTRLLIAMKAKIRRLRERSLL